MTKGSCKYCGEQSGNLSAHEKACEKNPENIKQPIKEQPKVPITIKDVKELQDPILSAYFQAGDNQYIERIPEFYGIIKLGDEDIPTVLIIANDGRILPPFMIEGFIGMFAPDAKNDGDVPEPEVQPETAPVTNLAVDAIRNFAKSPAEVKQGVETPEGIKA